VALRVPGKRSFGPYAAINISTFLYEPIKNIPPRQGSIKVHHSPETEFQLIENQPLSL
jgi:hypothetical protein